MATAAGIGARDKVFIGGKWVVPAGADPLPVVNSATEETIATVPGCTPVEVDLAVEAARGAFEGWAATPRAERAEALAAIAAGLGERSEELTATITQELGMPLKLTQMVQVGLGINHFAAMPKALEEVRWEEEVGNSRVLREPVGVVGAITP
ncbi:MAG TPA: aldehyde dehydrogenase family protein, partial [Solirubrobacterales bacterium]|nr:aldehyde dehydrogenase family protein [Solirubrobacterales bacterium]